MNILIFVMALIMLLSVMTWTRLETFMQSHLQSEEWVWLMKESERSLYNREEKAYAPPPPKATKPNPKSKKETSPAPDKNNPAPAAPDPAPAPTPAPISPGSGQISLSWFFNKTFREKSKSAYQKAQEVTEKLIETLWGDQPFYKRLESQRPGFVRALLQEIEELSDKGKGIHSFDDLIYANWDDYELKEALGRMMQPGLVYKRPADEATERAEAPLFSPVGFQSLKDYFSSKKNEKIRVWLAPKALLLAIYGDPGTVQAIINMREQIYKERKKSNAQGDHSTEEATRQFEAAFAASTPYGELLDYTVTGTDPRNR